MKTIVIDAREILSTTGRYTRNLLDNLQLLDNENTYQALLHPEAMNQVSLSAANFHKVEVSQRKFTLAEQFSLQGTIRSLNPDLVHFTMPNQPAFYRGGVVTTIHDLTVARITNSTSSHLVYKLKKPLYAWLTKRVSRMSKAVIVPTEFVKNDVAEFANVDQAKIHVTYEAADKISAAPEPLNELKDKRFVFYTGRAHPHKNLARLVEAFEIIHKSEPEIVLVFGGKKAGNYELVEKLALASGASHEVTFTDYLSEGQLRWLYENALAYVMPSLSEGFSLTGLEAMVHGCPVVSSNATCLPEVYGQAAHYFDPLDVSDMAHKITEIVGDEKLRKELIEKGHRQADKYSWKRMAKQTLEVYKKVLNS